MSDYTKSAACRMLATHCVTCGKPLVDSVSCSLGQGPECREHNDGGIEDATRQVANKYVYDAAIAAQEGKVAKVLECADVIESMGLTILADKVRRRFKDAVQRTPDITIEVVGNEYIVKTPYRRGDAVAFKNAWRAIPGRRWINGTNRIPVSQNMALWKLLQRFFNGKYGIGPKGPFRVVTPAAKPAAPKVEQMTMGV